MSRTKRGVSYLVLLLAATMALSGVQEPVELFVIDRVTIFDGTGSPVLRNEGAIVIVGDRIRDIGRRKRIDSGPGITILDGRGKFAIPGLIDAHVHFDQSAGLYARPDAVDLRAVRPYDAEIERTRQRLPETLTRYLRSGVTSVVDMGGPMWTLEFRDAANQAGDGPRIAAAGPLISTEEVPDLSSADPPVIVMTTPDEAQEAVRRVARGEPDLIKILFIPAPGEAIDRRAGLVQVAIAEGHSLGFRVAVHATELATAKSALLSGADILVHSIADRRMDSEFLAMVKARDIPYIPTLMVTEGYDEVLASAVKLTDIEERVGDPEAIRSWAELAKIPRERIPGGVPPAAFLESRPTQFLNLQLLALAEARIAAGSDAGNIGTLHGPAIHREMELMVEAGMRPFDVLLAATRNAAAVMGREKELGTLERGKLADILLLDADPVRDIRNARKIFRVIRGGEVVELP